MPLFWLALAFIGGIFFSARIQLSANTWLITAGISLILVLLYFWWRIRLANYEEGTSPRFDLPPLFYFLIPFCFALGAARFQISQPDMGSLEFIAYYNDAGQEARLTGMIIKPPEIQENQAVLRISVDGIQPYGESTFTPVQGSVVVRLPSGEDWQYGDRVMLRGDLESPPEFEDFSYRAYLAQQGVYSYIRNARAYRISSGGGNWLLRIIYAYKDYALSILYRLWPDPEASLLKDVTQLHRCRQVLHKWPQAIYLFRRNA